MSSAHAFQPSIAMRVGPHADDESTHSTLIVAQHVCLIQCLSLMCNFNIANSLAFQVRYPPGSPFERMPCVKPRQPSLHHPATHTQHLLIPNRLHYTRMSTPRPPSLAHVQPDSPRPAIAFCAMPQHLCAMPQYHQDEASCALVVAYRCCVIL